MYKILLIAAVSLTLIGCVPTSEPTVTNTAKEQSTQKLEGPTWQLVSFGLTRMAVPKDASITFKDGQYSGNGGCNGVGGNYKFSGNTLILSAGFSTMMACPELALEHKYMKALEKVDNYKIEDNILDLKSQGRSVLRFKIETH